MIRICVSTEFDYTFDRNSLWHAKYFFVRAPWLCIEHHVVVVVGIFLSDIEASLFEFSLAHFNYNGVCARECKNKAIWQLKCVYGSSCGVFISSLHLGSSPLCPCHHVTYEMHTIAWACPHSSTRKLSCFRIKVSVKWVMRFFPFQNRQSRVHVSLDSTRCIQKWG